MNTENLDNPQLLPCIWGFSITYYYLLSTLSFFAIPAGGAKTTMPAIIEYPRVSTEIPNQPLFDVISTHIINYQTYQNIQLPS